MKRVTPPCPVESVSTLCRAILTVVMVAAPIAAIAQTLSLPPRPTDASSGSAFARLIARLPLAEREARIEAEILKGNVPDFLRRLQPVTTQRLIDGAAVSATFFVTPDYLAVGSEEDYFLTPLTPQAAQRIANATGCILPTPRMADAIFAAAGGKLVPSRIPPSAAMTSVEVFLQHNATVRTQRVDQLAEHPFGSLIGGHKKDVVWSNQLTNKPGKVAIYGWHQPDGQPVQPLYTGHAATWVDYSHGIRLVQASVKLDGKEYSATDVLRDPKLASLLSDEGPAMKSRYPTNNVAPANAPTLAHIPAVPATLEWKTNTAFAERAATFHALPDVRVQWNEPLALAAASLERPVTLILYALPNGSSIEQTAGRKPKPGDDWRFDIQHIAAQTRFLRAADTNRLWVAAYLEAGQKSWPAWRKAHSADSGLIPAIVEALGGRCTNPLDRLVLSGHSGGGSFIIGYLNAVENIPDRIERIAFLDANYAYDPAQGHPGKLAQWIKASDRHYLSVLAYNDAVALLDGKPFASATGGTWYRSHLMKTNLSTHFDFDRRATNGVEAISAQSNHVQFLLKENPDRKILHTLQVELNGFIQSMMSGTPLEGKGYRYFGPRAYERWIQSE